MSSAVTEMARPANPTPGYVPVRIEVLRRMGTSAVDVFVMPGSQQVPVLYHRAGHHVDAEHLHELEASGNRDVYVRSGDLRELGDSLLESLETFIRQDDIPTTERFAVLQTAVAFEVEHSLRLIDCGKYVSLADKVGREMTTLLATSSVLPRDMFRIARHDFYTFTHVTNVACYSVLLAERLGIRDEGELHQIATGAMLHDIGKRFIPSSVLSKPTGLTEAERYLVETHPQRGYEELCAREELVFGQLMMVYQHHERADGSGYPVGILGDEMHPWAKLLTVVDVFEAMTGKRRYRRPVSAHDAIQYLRREANIRFDREAVECWIAALGEA